MGDLLRAFLNRQEGWRPQPSPAVLVRRRFSARVLAASGPVILCEMARDSAWPDYFERRATRGTIGRWLRENWPTWRNPFAAGPVRMLGAEGCRFEAVEDVVTPTSGTAEPSSCQAKDRRVEWTRLSDSGIVVFTDIAHSRYLWTWTESTLLGFERYIEIPLEPEDRLERALASRQEADAITSGAGRAEFSVTRDARRLARSILARHPERVRRSGRCLGLVNWCVRRAEPREVRQLWEILQRVRVIDPRCGSGDWLLAMGMWLEVVYTACLDRIRCHAFEPAELSGKRLHAEWRALADQVDAHADRDGATGAGRYLRQRIVARNLYGWDTDRRSVLHTRHRLRAFAELAGGDADVQPNVRFCASALAERSGHRREPFPGGREQPLPSLDELREELRVLELARDVALEPGDGGHEFAWERRRSLRVWERRRRLLVRKLNTLLGEQIGGSTAADRLSPLEGSGLWVNEDIRLVRRRGRRAQRLVT